MVKRIILLLDGTWNDIDVGACDTNIVRMRELISKHLVRDLATAERTPTTATRRSDGYTASGKEHIIYYERGVGTGAFDRFRGGAFGDGLSRNIRHAYKFLSFWYEPGDEIFIYGFSRGAYTARSLVGYLAAAGLLRRDQLRRGKRGAGVALLSNAQPMTGCRPSGAASPTTCTTAMSCRSSFSESSTPSARWAFRLGGIARQFNRDENGFHDVELSSITDVNLHAVAIDEHRWPFEAALWRQPPFKKYDTKVEQVWFSGAHSDVGGGYIVEEDRKADTAYADDITLDWMIRRTKHFYSDFPLRHLIEARKRSRGRKRPLSTIQDATSIGPGGLAFDPSRTARRSEVLETSG